MNHLSKEIYQFNVPETDFSAQSAVLVSFLHCQEEGGTLGSGHWATPLHFKILHGRLCHRSPPGTVPMSMSVSVSVLFT